MIDVSAIRLNDRSNVAELRRAAEQHARALGWNDRGRGDCELVATELGTNLIKHAREGVVAVSSERMGQVGTVLFVAVDRGPGMRDIERCLADGFSTTGSPGTGLGAIRRLSQSFDVESAPEGTVIVAEIVRGASGAPDDASVASSVPRGPRAAVFAVAKEGQSVNGDAWAQRRMEGALALLVCDGLGHGANAATASARAVAAFREGAWETPRQALQTINEALRPTRGAAASVVMLDYGRRVARFCGVGNTVAGVVAEGHVRHFVSHNGTLGAAVPKMVEFEYPWPPGSTVLLHSDGVSGRWQPARWSHLWQRHPGLVAGTLYRDLARGTDDVVIVAAREHGSAS
jgi:anti-sigma regulatory factor (Ser/Thr protein kinase)